MGRSDIWNKLVEYWAKPFDGESIGASSNVTSESFKVALADSLTLKVKNGNSTDLDIEVLSSIDNSDWDTLPYVSLNLGANQTKTVPITVGIRYIKIKLTNNDASNATTVTVELHMVHK